MRDVRSFASHGKVPGKIEIAIVKGSVPRNRDKGSTHNPFHGAGIEPRCEPLQITFKVSGLQKPLAEPSQRYIGKGIKVVEHNAPLFFQHLSKPLFHLCLGCGQESPCGIGDEVQLQPCPVLPITHSIELSQGVDARLKDPCPSLRVSLCFTV